MEMDIFANIPGIIGGSTGILIYSIYNIRRRRIGIKRKRTGYHEHDEMTGTEKVRGIIIICTIVVLTSVFNLFFWDLIICEGTFGLFKSETCEALVIIYPVLLIIGASIGILISTIYDIRYKKIGEPEHDERTEKVTGKAAKSTIIVLMAACAVILYGDIFGLFKLETRETLAILFPVLMLSMLGFVTYYNSKDF
ncbi:DUF2178 domain-containing protein [Methanococcoides seepicolus]|uniref:DUF2178 domain-containing protein n=1 Tax=Methanococcoides seepicolus TaxID=2828780 RepID=A0A9E4ZGH9_9EURY|nr:DUF2178 domain-containing protein [Methanococcoides seepicolus]MCM1987230.1 DUF2178 domain-containing protein [Methanococcoides seepicolus]